MSLALIILLIPVVTLALPIGTDCSKSEARCGNASVEKLVCESGRCKGAYLNNNCGTGKSCASTFYCNSFQVCDQCTAGCGTCTNSYNCPSTGCLSGYIYNDSTGKCLALPTGCVSGSSATTCTVCNKGYYLSDGACVAGPKNCLVPLSATVCQICSDTMYWNSTTNACVQGDGSCKTYDSTGSCSECVATYYLQSSTCNAGPKHCKEMYSAGQCTKCASGYELDLTTSACKILPAVTFSSSADVATATAIQCGSGYFINNVCSAKVPNCAVAATASTCMTCNEGYYLDVSSACQACYSTTKCKTCTGALASECTSCASGYNKAINSCLYCSDNCIQCDTSGAGKCDMCNSGFMLRSDRSGCDKCSLACKTCISASLCMACFTGFRYVSASASCTACIVGCDYCSDPSTCNTCAAGWIMNAASRCDPCAFNCQSCSGADAGTGYCSICNAGFIVNTSTKLCELCPTNCNTCTSTTVCTACNRGYVVNKNTNKCVSCGIDCVSCINSGMNSCDVCETGYHLDSTTKTCVCNFVECSVAQDSVTCDKCMIAYTLKYKEPCIACTATNCADCPSPESTTCNTCKPGYWLDPTTLTCGSVSCQSNTPSCISCASATTCLVCNIGYYYMAAGNCPACRVFCSICHDGTTCDTCMSGYYLTKDKTCVACTGTNVKTCSPPATDSSGEYISGAETATLTCVESSYMSQTCVSSGVPGCAAAISLGKCATCLDRYYLGSTSTCVACSMANCKICTSSTCLACMDGYTASKDSSGAITGCGACASPCATCDISSPTLCISCASGGYTMVNKACIACTSATLASDCNCGTGSFWNGIMCALCLDSCATCRSTKKCDKCADGFYFNSTACVAILTANCIAAYTSGYCKNCDVGYYFNSVENLCLPCSTNCIDCNQYSTCSMCATGYYVASNSTCVNCSNVVVNCTSCSAESAGTITCNMCADGYYWNSTYSNCSSCIVGCKTCSPGSIDKCMIAIEGYYLTPDSQSKACASGCNNCADNATCVECQHGYFFSSTTKKCAACGPVCQSCSGTSDADCLTCIKNAEFSNNATRVRTGMEIGSSKGMGYCACSPGYIYSTAEVGCVPGSVYSSDGLIASTFAIVVTAVLRIAIVF